MSEDCTRRQKLPITKVRVAKICVPDHAKDERDAVDKNAFQTQILHKRIK
jgi:hypothetical protein